MELRIINGQPFIVTRSGKREISAPPATVITQASSRIADATALLSSLAQAQAIQQAAIETALLAGQPTAPARSELASITELAHDQHREISDAQADIARVNQLLDQHHASEQRQADAAAIAALCQPFSDFLKGQS
jgi:hypothetical protein